MNIVKNQKQISEQEKIQISKQVQADLVEHLYEGCLPGTIAGFVSSVTFFLMFYGYAPLKLLLSWVIIFNVMMTSLTTLYFVYKKQKSLHETSTWQRAYSIAMSGCALSWTPLILLMPDDLTRQFMAIIVIFMVASGYAIGTIGVFYLCVITLIFIAGPAVIWCILQGDVFHYLIALTCLIYSGFLLGTNARSTRWFVDSLKLKL